MRKTLTLLVASTALTAVIGTTAWSAMSAAPDRSPRPFAAIWQDAAQSLPLVLASDDDDDDVESHGSRRDHDDEDCDDDDDNCGGSAPQSRARRHHRPTAERAFRERRPAAGPGELSRPKATLRTRTDPMKLKSLLATLALTTALTLPGLAMARPVTLTTTLNNYGGDGAYLALYVTDTSGAYMGSLWMAGDKSKYYEHLSDWYRATSGDTAQVNGITGASVGAGRTLEITLDLADALFDAGYTLHIDAAVEDMRDSPNEVAVPLTTDGAGTSVAGRRYVASFAYDM